MPFHLYKARKEGEEPRYLGIRVRYEEDHWVSTCWEVDADGRETTADTSIAPKFYGVTAEQAHRRMMEVLENTFDEIVPKGQEGAN